MTFPWYIRDLLNLENRKARAFKYSSRTGNCELYERLRAKHKHLYNEASKTVLSVIRSDFLILLTTRGIRSVTFPPRYLTRSAIGCC
jgi:hypothetical protein